MKKLLFLFAALCCMMVANATTCDEFTDANDIKYQVTSDKTVQVIANNYSGDVVIPATVTNPNDSKEYNVTGIGESAFYGCSSLTTVTFDGVSQLSTIANEAFVDCGLTSITIPASVTNIGESAFASCTQLGTVTFAGVSQLSTIGASAFENCTSLESITIPASVTSIGDYAFNSCSELGTVTFAEGSELSEIGEYAFSDSYDLSSIEIPASVTTIGAGAFSGCSDLASVTVSWTEEEMLPLLSEGAFDGINANPTLNVPFGTKALYKSADGWKDFGTIYSPPSFKLKVSSAGWASMYLPCAVKIPKYSRDGDEEDYVEVFVSVYYASKVDGNTITLSDISEEEKNEIIIPAKTGVIVKVEVNDEVGYEEYELKFDESDEAGIDVSETNLFEGTSVDKAFNAETNGGVYVLSGASDEGNPQFKEYSGKYLNAFKAYLPMSKVGSGAKEISVVFGETTSIQEASPISSPKGKDVMYDLNGMRVNPSTASGQAYKGIVIKNGKKMFNK